MMRDMVLRAIFIALLAAALIGSAEAGRTILNQTASSTQSVFVIGETDITFMQSATNPTNCATGTLAGKAATSTQGVGTMSISTNFSTVGLGLVAGPYDLTCNTVTGVVTGVNPTYSVTLRSAENGYYSNEITNIASGGSLTVNTTNNLNDYIGAINGSNAAAPCRVDLVMRQSGTTTNKLANIAPWWQNTTDIGSKGGDLSEGAITTLNLTPTLAWPAGTYEFLIDPDAATCNGVDAVSAVVKTLTVTTAGITWTADKSTAAINQIVTLTALTSPFKNVSLRMTAGAANRLQFSAIDATSFQQSNNASNDTLSELNASLSTGGLGMDAASNVTARTRSDGTTTFQVMFTQNGTYELEVRVLRSDGTEDFTIAPQKATITVLEVVATVMTNRTTILPGQDVTVSGTVSGGQKVVVSINDKAEAITTVMADKTYSYLWPSSRTKNYPAGSVKIDVWVCPQTVDDGSGGCANAGSGRLLLASLGETPTDTKDGICKFGNGSLYTGCNASQKKPADASWSVTMLPKPTIFETGRAWVFVRPFLAQAYASGFQWKFEAGKNATFFVQACNETVQWSSGSITCSGGNHTLNASATNVTKVIRNWAWETPFKTSSTLDNTTVSPLWPDGSGARFDLNLTGWPPGKYYAEIQVTDAAGVSVAAYFWFEVAVASITVTESYPGLYAAGISTSNPRSNLTAFNVTGDLSTVNPNETCGGVSCWPNYTLPADHRNNSYIGRDVLYITADPKTPVPQTRPWVLLNRDNLTFHLNFTGAYFNNTSVIGIGGSFVDWEGRNWSVKNITSDGKIELEGRNALASGHVVDLSLSKSGKFLLGQIPDDSWLQVDLDGNGTHSDSYWVLLADNRTPGVYDTVWVSNTSNFTARGINASIFGAKVGFGGRSIYLAGLKSGFDSIQVRFSSHRSTWDGYWLGQFQSGDNVTIPFRVASPNGTEPKPGVQVTVSNLTTRSYNDPGTPIPGGAVSNTSDENGIAILTFPTTGIAGGQYMVRYTANVGGIDVSPAPEEKWRFPSIEIRNFIATVDTGTRGRINLSALRPGSNLTERLGDTLDVRRFGGWRCTPCANGSLSWSGYQLDWPVNKYFNDTTQFGKLFDYNWQIGQFQNGTLWGPPNVWDDLAVTTGSNNTVKFNVSRLVNYTSGTDGAVNGTGFNNDSNGLYLGLWKMRAEVWDPNNATLHVAYLPWGQRLDPLNDTVGPHDHYNASVGSRFTFPGPLALEVSEIYPANGTVKFRLFEDRFRAVVKALDEPRFFNGVLSDGEVDSRFPRVTVVQVGNFELYAFNNNTSAASDYRPGTSGDTYGLPKESLVVENLGTGGRRFDRVGQPLPELGGLAVVYTDRDWGSRILLADLPSPVFPLPGWVENSTYYTGNFKESDVGVDINNNFTMNDTYTLLVYDTMTNGVFDPSNAVLDDDRDYSQISNNSGCSQPGPSPTPAPTPGPSTPCSVSLDLFGPEGGNNTSDYPGGPQRPFDERFISLSGGWPLNIVNRTFGPDNGSLSTLAQKYSFLPGEDMTFMARAARFNGSPLAGATVRISKAEMSFGYDNGTSIPSKVLNLSDQGPWALQGGEASVVVPASAMSSSQNIPEYSHTGFSGNFRFIFEFTEGSASESVERYISVGSFGPKPPEAAPPSPSPTPPP